jgi:multisubunit Na+/H+ antiporter MnhC subunit
MLPPGHLAMGLMAKRIAPKAPLWALLTASLLPDILGVGFRLVGIENYDYNAFDAALGTYISVPMRRYWSHGLLMTFVWSALVAVVAYLVWRDRRTSGVIGLVILSHWVLDFITHPPDLPLLFAGSPHVSLGLWMIPHGFMISLILELALFSFGILSYLTSQKAASRLKQP